jgi:SAM-dependent methyltransferase
MVQIQNCRLCHSENFEVFLKLGTMPLAGNFLKKEDVGKENAYPLDVCFCKNCGSVQVLEMIPRDTFFRDYRYLSSVTAKSVLEHFKTYASEIKERFLPNGGFVLEVACNDGILLEPLKNLELNVLGVDPAKNITKIAKGKGLDVIDDYFGLDLSKQILEKYDKANVIVGNAVFAHVDDLNDILLGVKNLLKDDGVFIFEVNYMGDMIDELQYDVIYHEHTMYHSVLALKKFLEQYEMKIFDVKHLGIRGGTIRIYSSFKNTHFEVSNNVQSLIDSELQKGYDKLETFKNFAKKCEEHKSEILNLLHDLKKQGKKIIGYGMSGRGNTMLNYWQVSTNIIDYGIDASPERYGRFVPGMHIPIKPPQPMIDVDYVLLLAWIFADDIIEKEHGFVENGGKFIIPFPKPHFSP